MPSLALLLIILAATTAGPAISVTPGIINHPLPGLHAYNFVPTLNSTNVGPIYDPNFIPGFQIGLTNTSIS